MWLTIYRCNSACFAQTKSLMGSCYPLVMANTAICYVLSTSQRHICLERTMTMSLFTLKEFLQQGGDL